jgi:hypothetical protein
MPGALRTFNIQQPWTKSGSAMQIENQSGIVPETYSHSIVNEISKLLIRNALAAATQTFTVTFTVNLSGTSIGAGLRAIRQNVAFRGLSRSIDSWGARERFIAP